MCGAAVLFQSCEAAAPKREVVLPEREVLKRDVLRSRRGVAIFLLLAACTEPDPITRFDGNVLIGDSSPRDVWVPPEDAQDLSDAEILDVSGEDRDPVDGTAPTDAETPDAGSVCEDPTPETVGFEDLVSHLPEFDGKLVQFHAFARTSTVGCADCSQRCELPLFVGPMRLTSSVCFPSVGCSGNDCGFVCHPVANLERAFTAVVRSASETLELMRVEP